MRYLYKSRKYTYKKKIKKNDKIINKINYQIIS